VLVSLIREGVRTWTLAFRLEAAQFIQRVFGPRIAFIWLQCVPRRDSPLRRLFRRLPRMGRNYFVDVRLGYFLLVGIDAPKEYRRPI